MSAWPVWISLFALPLLAGDLELRLTWHQLGDWTGESARVQVTTVEKARLEGTLIRVEPSRLVLSVLKSSEPKRYALGEYSIERGRVGSIAVRREKTSGRRRGAIIGGVIGGTVGALGGAIADSAPGGSSVLGGITGGLAGAAIWGGLGYLWGRAGDNEWTPVELLP